MIKAVTFFGTLFATVAFSAEPLASFKFELSCARYGEPHTIMIHSNIEFDGKAGTCTSEKGRYISYKENYDLDFKCVKPVAHTSGARNPIFTWVFTATGANDQGTKLVVLLNHETQTGSGFAVSENGLALPVNCKKW